MNLQSVLLLAVVLLAAVWLTFRHRRRHRHQACDDCTAANCALRDVLSRRPPCRRSGRKG